MKVETLGQLKEALGVVKTLMTREKRLHDAFMSGIATALCAEFIEVLKYIDGAEPYDRSLLTAICSDADRPQPGCSPGYRRYPRRSRHSGQGSHHPGSR